MLAGRLTLGKRIALLLVLGLALVLSFFAFFSLQGLRESSDRELHERLLTAELTASHIDKLLSLCLNMLDESAADIDPSLTGVTGDSTDGSLTRLHSMWGNLYGYGVFLTDREGTMVWAEPAPMRASRGGPCCALAGQVARDGHPAVSDAYQDDLDRVLVALGVPVRDRDGQPVGALVGVLDLSDLLLSQFLQPVSTGLTGYADIVDGQGRVLSSSDLSRLFQKSDHTDQYAAMIRAGVPSVGTCHNCHQEGSANEVEPDILAFAPLSVAPWGVAIRQSEEEALGPSRALERSLLLASAMALLAALGIVWFADRSVVSPIRGLIEASRRIARGDLESRVNSSGPAEIGELALSFDDMRERLRESLNNLEQVKSGLELNVELRTRELSALLEVAKVLASTLDLRQLLDTVVERTTGVLELADAGVIRLYDDRSGRLEVRAYWGYSEECVHVAHLPGEGVAGRAFLQGEPALLESPEAVRTSTATMSAENRAWRDRARQGLGPSTSVMVLPLVVKRRATGVMLVEHWRDDRAFSQADLRLAQALAGQIAVAVENARLYQEVLEKEKLRGQLLEKVIGAQEEERRRIARELHDDTCQRLAALAISLGEVEENLPKRAEAARMDLEVAQSQVRATLAEVRGLALNLRPSVLDDLGLKMAIDWLTWDQVARRGLEVKVELDGAGCQLPPAVETVLFRITQEALNNVVKHSGAASVAVRLNVDDSRVVLEVEDDGSGFDVEHALGPGGLEGGLGLHGMRERASLLGGVLEVRSAPGEGTRIRAVLPLQGVGVPT